MLTTRITTGCPAIAAGVRIGFGGAARLLWVHPHPGRGSETAPDDPPADTEAKYCRLGSLPSTSAGTISSKLSVAASSSSTRSRPGVHRRRCSGPRAPNVDRGLAEGLDHEVLRRPVLGSQRDQVVQVAQRHARPRLRCPAAWPGRPASAWRRW